MNPINVFIIVFALIAIITVQSKAQGWLMFGIGLLGAIGTALAEYVWEREHGN